MYVRPEDISSVNHHAAFLRWHVNVKDRTREMAWWVKELESPEAMLKPYMPQGHLSCQHSYREIGSGYRRIPNSPQASTVVGMEERVSASNKAEGEIQQWESPLTSTVHHNARRLVLIHECARTEMSEFQNNVEAEAPLIVKWARQ